VKQRSLASISQLLFTACSEYKKIGFIKPADLQATREAWLQEDGIS
jgi:hypothetical protein